MAENPFYAIPVKALLAGNPDRHQVERPHPSNGFQGVREGHRRRTLGRLRGGLAESTRAAREFHAFVRKYDARGKELWASLFAGLSKATTAASPGSGIYVGGNSEVNATHRSSRDAFVRRYAADGNELWTRVRVAFSGPYPEGGWLWGDQRILLFEPLSAGGIAGSVNGLVQISIRLPAPGWDFRPGTWIPQVTTAIDGLASGLATLAVGEGLQ